MEKTMKILSIINKILMAVVDFFKSSKSNLNSK